MECAATWAAFAEELHASAAQAAAVVWTKRGLLGHEAAEPLLADAYEPTAIPEGSGSLTMRPCASPERGLAGASPLSLACMLR